MNNRTNCPFSRHISRRGFLKSVGAVAAGAALNPLSKTEKLLANPHQPNITNSAQVAVTEALNYSDSSLIKQKVQHLFEAMGGISDVVKSSDKVGIKINLTGGSDNANHSNLHGVDIRECTWTHPEVLRAVTSLLIDHGVNPENIYFVEAIWDDNSYNNFGYRDVQNDLGVKFVDLNKTAPYTEFVDRAVGDNHFFYEKFKMNGILSEIDVLVSIPKMKQHYEAGVTHSMKNLIGSVPLQHYMLSGLSGYRSALHVEGGAIGQHLPRTILDLNMARPVHLGVIDGIVNAEGGEGPWNGTFKPAEYHMLLAGKDPVALDSIASLQMGNHPEKEKILLSRGEYCDNYLRLANQIGMGTNQLSEIQVVGDGAGMISGIEDRASKDGKPKEFQLYQNYPNPFNSATTIRYHLSRPGYVSLKIFNTNGQQVKTLFNGFVSAGRHQQIWQANGLPSGIYYCKMQTGSFSEMRKLVYEK